jgi:transcriptional regulator with XRE-family HTH domain
MIMSFEKRLREARLQKGLSQSQLGLQVGVHYTQIGRYESKGVKPASDVLSKIATALGDMADATLADKELLQQFKKAEQLPRDKKNILIEFVEAFILKQDIQKSMAK